MKLKKGISLLLVLALSLMSFAFTVSADGADTANLSLVASTDTTALEAGDTFTVAVNLDSIAANEFRSAQVAIYFNPDVLEVVDKSGVATTKAKDAFIESDNFYDEDEEEGYGSRVSASIDNVEGLIMYAFGKHKDSTEESIACADGKYTVVQVRFKAKDTGATGLQFAVQGEAPNAFDTFPAGYKVNLASAETLATITDTTAAIRIGVATIVDVTNPDAVTVDVDTALEDVIAELPAQVTVTYDDETTAEADVVWECEDYDAEVPGEYTFVGTVAGTDLTASVTVNVNKVEIVSAVAGSVNVPFGATAEQVEELLPATVEVELANGKTAEVAVASWDYTYEAGVTTGDVAAVATLDAGAKYLNTAEVKAAYTLKVSVAIYVETEGVVEEVNNTSVAYEEEATKEDVIATLPKTVNIVVGDTTVVAFVSWDSADYDGEKAGDYTFVGTITTPANVTLASETIEIIVSVEEALVKEVVEVTALEDEVVEANETLKLVALYDAALEVVYQDGTTGVENIVWDADSLKLTAKKAGTYTLNGTVGANEFAVSAKVTVVGNEDSEGYDVPIYQNGRLMNYATLNMFTSQIVVLQANEPVVWYSSNQSIAFVTADGKLVGQNPGTVTITAEAADGSIGYFTVRVVLNPSTIASLDDSDNDSEIVIPFTDLADFSWAARMISSLANAGIVSGKSETLYAPADNVTRAEYASLLVRAMKLSANNAGKEFTDVAQGEWYCNAVQTASALGIVSGYEDGSFRPNNSITREEMAVMTLRAAQAAGRNIPAKTSVSFTDADQISGYAKDAVNQLANAQIINGMGDGTFAPQQTANRAQAAVIIYQLCEL